MLTENQVHGFQQLKGAIDQLELTLSDRAEFGEKLRSLQKIFQREIQTIQSDDYQIHSVLVEINKQMRLLNMDGMFLQTARQTDTIENRVGQIRDRLKSLTNYCRVILGTEPD